MSGKVVISARGLLQKAVSFPLSCQAWEQWSKWLMAGFSAAFVQSIRLAAGRRCA